MTSFASSILRVAVLAALASSAHANLIQNGSFEDGVGAPSNANSTQVGNNSTAITSWLVTTQGSDIEWESQNYSGLTTPVGSRFIDLTGNPDLSPRATISQSFATALGATYRLTFIVGVDNDVAAFSGPVGVTVGLNGSSHAYTNINPTGPGNIWTAETLDFVATAAATNLSFLGTQGVDYIGLDNVDVELLAAAPVVPVPPVTPTDPSAVPEPGVPGLLGLGWVALAARRRRAKAGARLG